MEYTGYQVLQPSAEQLAQFYCGEYIPELKRNEYFIIMNEDGEAVDYYQNDGKIRRVAFPKIENEYAGVIKPLDYAQYCAIDMLQNRDIPVKILRGVYGSGKLFAAV